MQEPTKQKMPLLPFLNLSLSDSQSTTGATLYTGVLGSDAKALEEKPLVAGNVKDTMANRRLLKLANWCLVRSVPNSNGFVESIRPRPPKPPQPPQPPKAPRFVVDFNKGPFKKCMTPGCEERDFHDGPHTKDIEAVKAVKAVKAMDVDDADTDTEDEPMLPYDGNDTLDLADFNIGSTLFEGVPDRLLSHKWLERKWTSADKAPQFAMSVLFTLSNFEIAVARYRRYRKLMSDDLVTLKKLSANVPVLTQGLIDDPSTMPADKSVTESVSWPLFDSLRNRQTALRNAKKTSMRRAVSIFTSLKLDVEHPWGISSTQNRAANSRDPTTLQGFFADAEMQEDAVEAEGVNQALARKFAEINNPQRGGSDDEERATIKSHTETVWNPATKLLGFRKALLALYNTLGNDDLKDFIYQDLMGFLYNGSRSMSVYRNYVFMGPSGVGKTTWARLMGRVYAASGIYMYGNVAETTSNTFTGQFLGQSGPMTRTVLDTNLENIVLIDEAYQIAGESGSSYGEEVITTLVDYIDKNVGLLMIIVAGYEGKMRDNFLENNEGLDRRFPKQFVFPDYSPKQLVGILKDKMDVYERAIWGDLAFEKLEALAQLGKRATDLVVESQTKIATWIRDHPELDPTDAKILFKAPVWTNEVLEWHDVLFGKQGGSIENILSQMRTLEALKSQRPKGKDKFGWTSMTRVLQTFFHDHEWKEQLEDQSSNLVSYLQNPQEYVALLGSGAGAGAAASEGKSGKRGRSV